MIRWLSSFMRDAQSRPLCNPSLPISVCRTRRDLRRESIRQEGLLLPKKRGLQCAKNSHAAFGLVSKLKFMASRKRTWNNRTIGRFESLSGGSQFQGTMVRPEEVVNRCCFALLRGWWAWFPRHEN
jgi:hypothetical protein